MRLPRDCHDTLPWLISVSLGLRSPTTSGELMFDHVKFGVSDYAASKAFFLKALEPLGVAVVWEGPPTYGVELSPKGRLHCACTKPRRSRRIFTWRSWPRIASKSKPSIARPWRRVAKTMVRRPAPGIPRELLRSFRHRSGRAQHRSGLPRTRGLTNR